MCGIIGYVGPDLCADTLIGALSKLEYRGYDSAGIAVIDEGGALVTRRAEGKLGNLVKRLREEPVDGRTGIGHTRWATHGAPTESNAHPHRSGSIAVIHNGIIENHLELKAELREHGHEFTSETDTEVFAHLVDHYRTVRGLALPEAVRQAVIRLHGAYAVVVVDAKTPGMLVGARMASPLVLGVGEGANYLASDAAALLSHTRDMVFIEDGQVVTLTPGGVELRDVASGELLPVAPVHVTWSPAMAEKGGYKHFMLKEIHEQPRAIGDTLRGRVSLERNAVNLPEVPLTRDDLASFRQIYVVACGTSWHAGLVGRYLFEDLAGLSPHVELASELRYRKAPMDERTLFIAVSQSGETADTLAALRDAKAKGARCIAICNVLGSSIPRECEGTVYTHAGPEIGVASTKAFTTQVAALHLIALHFGRLLGRLDDGAMAAELAALLHVPSVIETLLLAGEAPYEEIARAWHDRTSMLFLGRGSLFPMALEGALKLKEISYIHAEGYAAGEMKHGPIALIDEKTPTIILNPRDGHYAKVRSNLSEVRARSGPVCVVATEGDADAGDAATFCLTVPDVPEHVLPLVMAVPMQLIAYHMADFKGTDVDQPRNLAKSVTVE
ncbi:MAG: glutamine--fructose-6-phosphate transaminase (isomerizing) [Deltaproteobacteria bacterium]|nr:glutamine--fructose-6-phosphate transaminase (isomerizing) [Deltaproteobacteria bacterium]